MLYPDAQPQDKSSGRGTSAKPKPKPIPALPAVIYTAFGIQEAEKLRERIKKAEEYRKRVREEARNSGKPKQNQKSQKTDSSKQATRPKTPSYDPLSSIQAPQSKAAPAPTRKETSDISKAGEEASVQAALPDIEAVQDNYGNDDPSPERMYAYSNLDLLRVRQDMERRLLTFRLCFEQAQSPREALDFLYAESLDCNNSQLTNLLEQQISSRMRDGGDDSDIDLDIHHSAFKYEEHLESMYGYEINWASGLDTSRLKQLHNLAQASTHIVNYLGQEVFDGDEAQALSVFQQRFSQSEAYGQLMVHLGADSDAGAGGPAYGRVPLRGSEEELRKMYLGSAVDIPTIVHEFGHVIDRSKSIEDNYNTLVSPWKEWLDEVELPLNPLIWKHAIEGFAGKQSLNEEVWADLFMTAVLSPSNPGISKPYEVYSIIDERIEEFAKLGRAFYECSERGGCARRPVEWRSKGKHGEKAEEHFPMLLRELLSR